MTNQPSSNKTMQTGQLLILLAWASLLHYPFIYRHGACEGDSYVLVNGIIDAINKGDFMRNPLLVFDFYSFGYYWLIFKLQPFFAPTPEHIFSLVNHLAFVCSVLTTIPMYLFLKDLLGNRIAFYSLLAYHLAPTVFEISGYGHPVSTAWFLMWVALYLFQRSLIFSSPLVGEGDLVLSRQGRGENNCERGRKFVGFRLLNPTYILSILISVQAMTMRTDVFFMLLPLLLGLLYYQDCWDKRHLQHLAAFALGSLFLFSLVQYAAIGITWNVFSPQMFFTDLNKFHVTGGWLQRLARGLVTLALACGPLTALTALGACLYLYLQNKRVFILLTAWVAPIVLFWLPYPTPARHFLYAIPGIIVAVVCLLEGIGKKYLPWLVALFLLLNYFSPLPLYQFIIAGHEQKGLAPGQKQVSFNAPLLPSMENHFYMQGEIDDYWQQAKALSRITDKSVIYIDNFEQLAIYALIASKPEYYWSGRIYFNAKDGFLFNQINTPKNQFLIITVPTGDRPQTALKKFSPQKEYAPYYIAIFPQTLKKYPQLKIPEGYKSLIVKDEN